MFTDVHDAEKSGRPSVITDALKEKVNRIIRENRHFTISEVYEKCLEVSRALCVPNCHQTFAIPQNSCTLGQAAFWYEEGRSKLVSRYKCLNVQGDYVEK